MRIKVKGFLTLREAMTPCAELELDLSRPTVRSMLDELAARFGDGFREQMFEPQTGNLRLENQVLVNGRHYRHLPAGLDTQLSEGDSVALFPPVAGG